MSNATISGEQLLLGVTQRPRTSKSDTDAICDLVVTDPANRPTVEAVITAIRSVAWREEISRSNDTAPHLPPWAAPKVVGSTFSRLGRLGALEWTGRYVPSDDVKGGNAGKPTRVYRVHLERLPK